VATTTNEDGFTTLTGTINDPGSLDNFSITVNWGDTRSPNNQETFTVGRTFTLSHQFLNDNPSGTPSDNYTIGLQVNDGDGGSSNSATQLQVDNVAPQLVDVVVTPTIDENGVVTLTGTYIDVGRLDGHTLLVDWKDPNNGLISRFELPPLENFPAGGTTIQIGDRFPSVTPGDNTTLEVVDTESSSVSFRVVHQYLGDGSAPGNNTSFDVSEIAVTVLDPDQGQDTVTTSVTINNVAPVVSLQALSPITENGTVTLSGTFTDIGLLDSHRVTINWDDVNDQVASIINLPAIYNVNKSNGLRTQWLSPGDTFQSTSAHDLDTILRVDTVDLLSGVITFTVSHQYRNDGAAPGNATMSDTSTIRVSVSDADQGSNTASTALTVNNQAPRFSGVAITPSINENDVATLEGTVTDIGLLDGHVLTIDWADQNYTRISSFNIKPFYSVNPLTGVLVPELAVGQVYASATPTETKQLTITSVDAVNGIFRFRVSHRYLNDGPAPGNNTAFDVSQVKLTIADRDAASDVATTNVTVNNVAPVINSLTPTSGSTPLTGVFSRIIPGQTLTLTGLFTDVGTLDTHTAIFSWGDASLNSAGVITESLGSGSVVGSHRYALPGTYTVTLTLSDRDLGVDVETFSITVVVSAFLLDPDDSGALTATGNGLLRVPGVIYVNSNSSTAISANGNTNVQGSSINVVGGVRRVGNAVLSPAPVTGVPVAADPLADLPTPNQLPATSIDNTNRGSVSLSGQSSLTINPGRYSSIRVSGQARLTMNPGLYIITGGGFQVTGGGSVIGRNVSIYNTGTNYPNSGGTFGAVTLTGNGVFDLTPPNADSPYAGVLIFQSRDNPQDVTMSGNGFVGAQGTVYAKIANLRMTGNGTLKTPLVAGTMTLHGNGSSTLTVPGGPSVSNEIDGFSARDLAIYLDDPRRIFTSDQRARMHEVVAELDSLLAPFGADARLADSKSDANVILAMAEMTPCGNEVDGVLGCSTDDREVTLVQAWDWYAGRDLTGIAPGQYDFSSVVLHELGHMLGLDHSYDKDSVMHGELQAGEVRRSLSLDDLHHEGRVENHDVWSLMTAWTAPPANTLAIDVALRRWLLEPSTAAARIDDESDLNSSDLDIASLAGMASGSSSTQKNLDEFFERVGESKDESLPNDENEWIEELLAEENHWME
jgi:hypothetical protein